MVDIRMTVWILEFLKGFFIIAHISHSGAIGLWRFALPECLLVVNKLDLDFPDVKST